MNGVNPAPAQRLLGGLAGHGAPAFVDVERFALPIRHVDSDWRMAREGAEPAFALADKVLSVLALTDVADERAERNVVPDHNWRDGDFDGELLSIAADSG